MSGIYQLNRVSRLREPGINICEKFRANYEVKGDNVKTTFQLPVWGIPQITLRLSNWLERQNGMETIIQLVYYMENIQIKVSQGEDPRQHPGDTRFPLPSPHGIRTPDCPGLHGWQYAWNIASQGSSPEFIGTLSCVSPQPPGQVILREAP